MEGRALLPWHLPGLESLKDGRQGRRYILAAVTHWLGGLLQGSDGSSGLRKESGISGLKSLK